METLFYGIRYPISVKKKIKSYHITCPLSISISANKTPYHKKIYKSYHKSINFTTLIRFQNVDDLSLFSLVLNEKSFKLRFLCDNIWKLTPSFDLKFLVSCFFFSMSMSWKMFIQFVFNSNKETHNLKLREYFISSKNVKAQKEFIVKMTLFMFYFQTFLFLYTICTL